MIKVVMIVRSTLYSVKGGDTIQVVETAKQLNDHAISVEIKLTSEKIRYNDYDLLHFFNITRPADILFHINKTNLPFLVSTIMIDYSEYDKYYRKGIAGKLFRFLNPDAIEYIKTIARWIRGNDKLMSLEYLFKGQRRSIQKILYKASLLLPNSNSEYRRLVDRYNCKTDHIVITNGIDPFLFSNETNNEKDPNLVICVARIEGIKNQLNLIRAMSNTKFNLLIIGAVEPNQQYYFQSCKKIATSNIHFIEQLPQHELLKYYKQASIHVLPSWFETTGLSSLEAAAMGCKLVITDKGDTIEYFGTNAVYCDPSSPENIYKAITIAESMPFNDQLQKKILAQYTWEEATKQTIEAYKRVNKIWD